MIWASWFEIKYTFYKKILNQCEWEMGLSRHHASIKPNPTPLIYPTTTTVMVKLHYIKL